MLILCGMHRKINQNFRMPNYIYIYIIYLFRRSQKKTYLPCDSIRDLFIPRRWRSLNLAKGSRFFTIPKRSQTCRIARYIIVHSYYMDVSENSGTPKSSILIGFSIVNHPFWGTPIVGNTQKTTTSGSDPYALEKRYSTISGCVYAPGQWYYQGASCLGQLWRNKITNKNHWFFFKR